MNRQGPGKIGWTDYTWSPVTGCKHGCLYGYEKKCYANRIADRIYKEKFEPTFRPERLKDKDLGRVPAGSKIFTVDMGDLFGSWVPKEWVEQILSVVKLHPEYTFQFLTKNPSRYEEFAFPPNCWLGTTWDGLAMTMHNVTILRMDIPNSHIKFVSFEPLLAPFKDSLEGIDWIIIGELTGQEMGSAKIGEIGVWALELCIEAKELGIPVFAKNRLANIISAREFPR